MYIVGQGAVTALGHDAGRTVASLRAGLDAFVELLFSGVSGNDLKAVPVRGFAEGLGGAAPYESLAIAALRQCIDKLRQLEPKNPIVFLGLPRQDRPGVPRGLAAVVQARLEREFNLPRTAFRVIEEGRVSAFMGLRHAEEMMRAGVEACVVGGVDCLVNAWSLKGLSEQGRVMETYDGFFPGQGASFVCLSRRRDTGVWGGAAARISGVGIADEPKKGTAEDPILGDAVREALKIATTQAQLTEPDLGVYINSVNGTRSEFEDDALAQSKFFRTPREHLEIWHVASYLGETGAAYGAVALMWAAAAAELGFGLRRATLVSATEDRWRAAACVTAGGEAKPGALMVGLSHHAPHFHQRKGAGLSIPAAADPGIRLGEDDLHAELATRNIDEIAALLLIRDGHLQDESPWADIEGFEERLLAHYDAVLWHGDAFFDIATRLAESGEPENAAAGAMVICGGAATRDQIDLLVGLCAESEDHLRMIVDTAALMPKPVAYQLLLGVADVDRAHEAAALRGLSQAGWLDASFAKDRARSMAPETRLPLIVALGAAQFQALSREVDVLLRSPDKVRDPLAWLAALAVLPASHVQSLLGLEDGLEFAPHALAASCIKTGRSLFQIVEKRRLTTGVITALGYSGETQATDFLLAALASDEGAAAAIALNRIFGCDLFDEVAVEHEDPEEDEETIKLLTQDPGRWRAAIAPLTTTKAKRLRRGRDLLPESPLHDLLLERPGYREREISALEYAALSGKPTPVHPRQLVAVQRSRLP
jgi:3-oxoacyl-[acyl-carrier-protein] synthase-1